MFFHELLIVLAAFLTSAISACVGIGGGTLLLAWMATLLPISAVIPIHGVSQSFSNMGKAYFGYSNIQWRFTLPFIVGAILGSGIGLVIWSFFPLVMTQLLLGLFILISTWKPTWLNINRLQVWLSGLLTSVISVFAGATGPLVMAILPTNQFSPKQTIATHGAIMTFHHSIKVAGFVILGFSIGDYLQLILGILVASWIGSFIGNRMMIKLPENVIKQTIKLMLTLLAVYLISIDIITYV